MNPPRRAVHVDRHVRAVTRLRARPAPRAIVGDRLVAAVEGEPRIGDDADGVLVAALDRLRRRQVVAGRPPSGPGAARRPSSVQNFSQHTCTRRPSPGWAGRSARRPALRCCQRHLSGHPAEHAGLADEPMVEQPTAFAGSGAFHRSAIMCTQRRSISAVCGYSSLSIMFLSTASRPTRAPDRPRSDRHPGPGPDVRIASTGSAAPGSASPRRPGTARAASRPRRLPARRRRPARWSSRLRRHRRDRPQCAPRSAPRHGEPAADSAGGGWDVDVRQAPESRVGLAVDAVARRPRAGRGDGRGARTRPILPDATVHQDRRPEHHRPGPRGRLPARRGDRRGQARRTSC